MPTLVCPSKRFTYGNALYCLLVSFFIMIGLVLDGYPGLKFARTSFLGFIYGDRLHVTGALEETLMISGLRHYLVDIEHTIEMSHRSIDRGSRYRRTCATPPNFSLANIINSFHFV